MDKKNIETIISKEKFDENFKTLLQKTEDQLYTLHTTYIKLLDFRMQYRTDYKTNRIKHYIVNGILKYGLLAKRKIGYQTGGKK